MPRLSVLLPARDSSATIGAALTSTLRALPRDSELVVLDDGSSDDTATVVDRHADRRVRLLRQDTPTGVAASLRRLVESSDSEYVGRMDADDLSLPGRFTGALRALRGPADLVFSSIVSFRTDPVTVRPGLPMGIAAAAMPLHLLVHNPLCHPTLVARRHAIDLAGGYRDVLAEDHDLWLRALAAGLRLVRLARPGLAYRHHDRQLSLQQAYIDRAFDQPALRVVYRDFVAARYGVEPVWLDALWSPDPDVRRRREGLSELTALIALHAESLSPRQRLVLSRTTRLLQAR